MGYFPNGDSGHAYEEQYCSRCVHFKEDDGGCPVMLAHLLHNYDECDKDDSILHILIPRTDDKLRNEQCAMFHEDMNKPHPDQLGLDLDSREHNEMPERANG